jgi:hypothetical protein
MSVSLDVYDATNPICVALPKVAKECTILLLLLAVFVGGFADIFANGTGHI